MQKYKKKPLKSSRLFSIVVIVTAAALIKTTISLKKNKNKWPVYIPQINRGIGYTQLPI
jgi:hypothetical protein